MAKSVRYGPDAPTLLLMREGGFWTQKDRTVLDKIFGSCRVSWDIRPQRCNWFLVVYSPATISAGGDDLKAILEKADKSRGTGQKTISQPMRDSLAQLKFKPHFFDWPPAKAVN